MLSGPVVELMANAPSIGRQVTERLSDLRRPLDHLVQISQQIEHMADVTDEEGVLKVGVAQPGILSRAAGNLVSISTSAAITFVLSLFLLASGTLFYEKIVQSFASLTEKKRALRIVYDVEREISRYLLTVAFDQWRARRRGWARPVGDRPSQPVCLGRRGGTPQLPALYRRAGDHPVRRSDRPGILRQPVLRHSGAGLGDTCNIIEGQVITPLIVGRRLEVNAVAIFIAVAFWSWLWGIVGALLAVPLLVVIKVFCDHFDGLRHVGNFLSAQQVVETEPEAAPSNNAAT